MTTKTKVPFWRIFWPSLVSGIVLSVIGWLFWLMIIGSLFSKEESVENKDVLVMHLSGEIAERSSSTVSAPSFQMDKKIGLSDILAGLEKAKSDDAVKGIYLDLGMITCGYATAMEIREGIKDFQKSGKFVVAYLSGEAVTLKQYYIASAAKEVYGFKNSNMEFVGLGAELMFFKNTFDKLGIEMQVIRGSNNDFKSAVEPYFRDNMSDSSKMQMQRYLTSIWSDVRQQIAADRKISVKTLDAIAEQAQVKNMEDALKHQLIDGVKYRDEMLDLVCEKGGVESLKDAMSFEDYASKSFNNSQLVMGDSKANIAVIVGEGAITVDGDELTSEKVCRMFREVRNNEHIKVVVFRVNSPGGSALASEEIWREVTLTAKKMKVIVSMGDVAASGGYYIATPATTIFAEPTTITGSIGVFGVIPYTGGFMENHLGLTFDRVQTNKHSVLSTNRRLTEDELMMIQNEVDEIYLQFKTRVANGRGLTMAQVERLARGRVWTGTDALSMGLVDKIGGLNDAIAFAAKEAKIKNPVVRYYPKEKEDKYGELIEQLTQEEEEQLKLKQSQTAIVAEKYLDRLMKMEQWTGIQARLPYEMIIR
jgi:protease-4